MNVSSLKNLLVFTSMLALLACNDRVKPHQAHTILTNGNIYTMNPQQPWAQAVAIQEGRFVYVGNAKEVHQYRGDNTRVIDLKGNMALPGLFDAHVHPVLAGVEQKYDCSFYSSADAVQIAERLSGCVETLPDAQWIVGGRWDSDFFIRNHIQSPRLWLDMISTDKAISLQDDTGHNRWVNSKALELAGIDKTTRIEGGDIVLDKNSGEPNGLLYEAAMYPILQLIPERTAEEYQQVAEEVLAQATAYGITGIKEAGDSHHGVRAYKALDDAGKLNHHMAVAIAAPFKDEELSLDLEKLAQLRNNNRGKHANTDFVKLFLDGVPAAPRTAAMLDDYLPEHTGGDTHNGHLLIAPAKLAGIITTLDALGITVSVHAAGDRAVRVTLDAIEESRRINGNSGLRHEIAHAGFIHPDDIPRFVSLDATADASPAIWYPSPIINSIVGALGERGNRYFPFKDLLEAGVNVTAGSDLPAVLPDMNPWKGIEAMVTRQHPTGDFPGSYWPEQAISLHQALEISTLGGARALKLLGQTGSIQKGKLADMIVIDRQLFDIPASEISETQVTFTMFGGKVVYEAP